MLWHLSHVIGTPPKPAFCDIMPIQMLRIYSSHSERESKTLTRIRTKEHSIRIWFHVLEG
jgi:hypothetical protein